MVGLDGPPLPFATRCLSSAFPFASSCWYRRDRSRAVRLDAAKLETEFRSEVSVQRVTRLSALLFLHRAAFLVPPWRFNRSLPSVFVLRPAPPDFVAMK